jgi:hypothetical protein
MFSILPRANLLVFTGINVIFNLIHFCINTWIQNDSPAGLLHKSPWFKPLLPILEVAHDLESILSSSHLRNLFSYHQPKCCPPLCLIFRVAISQVISHNSVGVLYLLFACTRCYWSFLGKGLLRLRDGVRSKWLGKWHEQWFLHHDYTHKPHTLLDVQQFLAEKKHFCHHPTTVL